MMVVGDALDALLEGAREWLDGLLVFAGFAASREPGFGGVTVRKWGVFLRELRGFA